MRSTETIYEEVANRCSAYAPACGRKGTYSNVADTGKKVSCTTCKHFTKDEYCDIDLYDEIVANHNLDA